MQANLRPKFTWHRNPDLDTTMTFEDDPFMLFEPKSWDEKYEHVWYMDPKFNPTDDKVWVIKCIPTSENVGVKDMGYIIPNVIISVNPDLSHLDVDINNCCPAYWDLAYECAWELDPLHTENPMWVVKFTPGYRKPKEWKWYGVISPQYHIIYNPDLPDLNYDLDYVIPWHDLQYEHVWMLDRKHLQNDEEPIWAFKVTATQNTIGSKIIGQVSPTVDLTYNPDLPKINYNEYSVPWHDLGYENVWYLVENTTKEKVWAVRARMCDNPAGEKEVGTVTPVFEDQLDVIFISYKEPNANKNWNRVLEKAPWAKRVHGVEGIFNAHKAAAKLAKTDMFYVVDGDAWLVDEWDFNFQPSIFDRDCAYVWCSKNPVNNLIYENGGVKLFPKSKLLRTRKWSTLDMFTGTVKKTKSQSQISNTTVFNTDEFSAWRSAFRECVKLYTVNQMSKLNTWLNIGKDAPFGKYVIAGAEAGYQYAKNNAENYDALKNINDYAWLQNQFNLYYNKQ